MRKEIAILLSKQPDKTGNIDELFACLNSEDDIRSIEYWLKGFIYSIFYKPNSIMLVIKGEEGIGKGYFLKNLMPVQEWFGEDMTDCIHEEFLYGKFLVKVKTEFKSDVKRMNRSLIDDGFKINDNLSTDKRLCSYCSSSNDEIVPKDGKLILRIDVKSIDIDRFKKIDKLQLWREIFFKYYPMKESLPLSQESISRIFDNQYQKALDKIYEQQRTKQERTEGL